ncbi:SIMPL domain-containing protein [Telluribacter humicola]|uniref:SIMPL domain-containing protein n=1 Tax=Telluribacter humicola TaxID=1720261 RepID=UPI001A96E5BF|nr:SIMPL domain-containing protein [Telluribacter humicola]
MKRNLLMIYLLVATTATQIPAFAQTVQVQQDKTRKIEVTGFAEMEVTPDELYFTVSLREYFKDEKNQKDKVVISTLEQQLLKAVAAAGLPKESLTVSGLGGYQNYWDKKKRPNTFLETKQYQLKVSRPDKLDGILSEVDSRGIQYANISRVDHSQKEELKKQVKINALKAAKDKATYLLQAIDQKAGPVIEIRELEDNMYYPQPMYAKANVRMMAAESMDAAAPESDLDYQKIKLSYRMQAIFEIK